MTSKFSSTDKVVIASVVGVITALLAGLVMMLAAGIVHDYMPAVPALGYWSSVLTMLVARALVAFLVPSGKAAA